MIRAYETQGKREVSFALVENTSNHTFVLVEYIYIYGTLCSKDNNLRVVVIVESTWRTEYNTLNSVTIGTALIVDADLTGLRTSF